MSQVISVAARLSAGNPGTPPKIQIIDQSRQLSRALDDLWSGLRAWRLWGSLGWNDIRLRYARSILGPLWLTLSIGILVFSLGFVYGGLFGLSSSEYLPYMGTGFIIWTFLSTCIIDACGSFYLSAPSIRQIASPLSIYAFKVIWRNLIIFCHNMLIFVVIVAIFPFWPGALNLLLAAVGLALLCLNALVACLVLGVVSARFRDIPPIVTSLVQVAFFLTPIFWHADQLPAEKSAVVEFNPFFYYVEIVRQPLLGNPPSLTTWAVVLGLTGLGCLLALAIFTRYRWRIAYWV